MCGILQINDVDDMIAQESLQIVKEPSMSNVKMQSSTQSKDNDEKMSDGTKQIDLYPCVQ